MFSSLLHQERSWWLVLSQGHSQIYPAAVENRFFLEGGEIKSGSGLGTRLATHYAPYEEVTKTLRHCPEEVRHGDIHRRGQTSVECNYCGQVQPFSFLDFNLLPVFFNVCTSAGPVDALKVQSSNSNTKVSRIQVHSLSEGPTRGLCVRLTCRSMHFRSSEYQSNSLL